jgi:hypothetical protein
MALETVPAAKILSSHKTKVLIFPGAAHAENRELGGPLEQAWTAMPKSNFNDKSESPNPSLQI